MPSLSDFGRLDEAPPDDRHAREVLADYFQEQGDPRERILRAACAIHREVGGVALPDRFDAFWTDSPGWEAAARPLEALANHPEDTADFRARYGRLLRGDIPLHPEDLEATLRLQYDLQLRLLDSLHLIEDGGITAIDGNRYLLPPYEDIVARMQTPEMQEKLREGFDTLLLVPFGLSPERFLDAWREGLRRNADTLRGVGEFNKEEPVWVWEGYQTDSLVYDPRSFTPDHGGRTKEQILAQDRRGWEVLLVEGALQNLPREGRGQVVGGRRQIDRGSSPEVYLWDLQGRVEVGLSPESYIIHFLDSVRRGGRVLDVETYSYLVGAYIPASEDVPYADWHPEGGRSRLAGESPVCNGVSGGVRAAVRVL